MSPRNLDGVRSRVDFPSGPHVCRRRPSRVPLVLASSDDLSTSHDAAFSQILLFWTFALSPLVFLILSHFASENVWPMGVNTKLRACLCMSVGCSWEQRYAAGCNAIARTPDEICTRVGFDFSRPLDATSLGRLWLDEAWRIINEILYGLKSWKGVSPTRQRGRTVDRPTFHCVNDDQLLPSSPTAYIRQEYGPLQNVKYW